MSDHVNQLEKENRKAQQNIKRILQKAMLIARSLNRTQPTAQIINELRGTCQRRPLAKTFPEVVEHPILCNVENLIYQQSEPPKIVIRRYILSRGGKDQLLKHLYKQPSHSDEFDLELTQEEYNIEALERLVLTGMSSTNFASSAAVYFQQLQMQLCNREIPLDVALMRLGNLLINDSLDGRYLAEKGRDLVLELYLTRQFTDEKNCCLMGETFAECIRMAADVAQSTQRVQIVINELWTANAQPAALFLSECNVDFVLLQIYERVTPKLAELSVGIRQLLDKFCWEKLAHFGVETPESFCSLPNAENGSGKK